MVNIRLDVGSTVRLARLVHKFRKAGARLGLDIKKLELAQARRSWARHSSSINIIINVNSIWKTLEVVLFEYIFYIKKNCKLTLLIFF
jgi:hypothetical protein